MQAHFVDVFTTTPGQGNPAAVVMDAGRLSGPEMAGIAAQLGVETTFVDGTTLRYYQPSGHAMVLCGHGTMAALAVMGNEGEYTVSTPVGDLPVKVERYLFGMAMPPVTFGPALDPQIAATALGIDLSQIDGPVQIVGGGRPKLIVPLMSLEALEALRPDSQAVEEACTGVGATGIYPFTRKVRALGASAEARHFPAGAGIYEDPVTGVGGLALAWYLWHYGCCGGCCGVKVAQGFEMGRPGMMMIRQEQDGHTWLYGQAAIGGTRQL
ncbi:MAG TPA: PhzF family phenazine biosynthesis protein [Symbiobacteriaceae bacterium]|nr:PhzF family phenazine biosynthesis protein [Symbiobacteriaceae bacterium]